MLALSKRLVFVCCVSTMLLWTTIPSFAKPPTEPKGGASQSAQGAMIRFNLLGSLAIQSDEVYEFNTGQGVLYYYNDFDSSTPVNIACYGAIEDCTPENQPSTPPPPSPSSGKLLQLVVNNRCIFLDGGVLPSSIYTQDLVLPGLNGTGTFVFTYSYALVPIIEPVGPFTAWHSIGETNPDGTLNLGIQAEIAGQSVTKSAKTGTKYSFNLRAPNGTSRVTNLELLLDNVHLDYPTSTLLENCPGCLLGSPNAVDFVYTTNAGAKGTTSLLSDGVNLSAPELAQDARTILNTDSTTLNNDGGVDGIELSWALSSGATAQNLGVGTYNLMLRGTIIGIDASSNVNFSVTKIISIVGSGCSAN